MKCPENDTFHLSCCVLPLAGMLLWASAFVSFIFALVSLGGFWWGILSVEWFDIAQTIGILAIGLKLGLLIRIHQCNGNQ
ncbi:MAG: hypothetical protein A3A28_01410 [Candidatus Sungbacteria bacterium RIFCSPLOWO2_01_FULL_47_32]|nr:MAG: hypothetical protein A3A28_01410 [Candidatus Sungbacteria bacterium RIFCSPLOWO2_01_FULL_47_32]